MDFNRIKPIEFLPIAEDSYHLDIGIYFIVIKSLSNKSAYGRFLLETFLQNSNAKRNAIDLFKTIREINSFYKELDSESKTRVYIYDYTYYVSKERWRLALEIIKGIKEIRGVKTVAKIPRNSAVDINKISSLFKEKDKINIISAYNFVRDSLESST